MIDVNKITSTLAKLPDAQLQQYAQMHKSDPYIMALAMTESNRRKELRAAGQGAQGMQEMPKVVDQAVAEMAPQQLPEDMGIARIPAGDMNFAGGGIIAFADGGGVERYQSQGLVQNPLAQKYELESQEMGMGTRMQYSPEVRAYAQAQEQASKQGYAERERARMLQGPYGATAPAAPALPTAAQGAPTAAPVSTADMAAKASASPYVSAVPKNAEEAAMLQRYAPTAKAAATDKVAPAADTTRKAPGAGLGAAAAATDASRDDPFSMTSIRKAQTEALGDSNYKIGELNNQLVDIRNKAETQVQQRLADRKKEIESEGDVYKDRSDRLVARGKELAGQKDQNTGLALLNAGLAIMSTPGGLATAIGKGAQVGTAQYAAGVKDLRAAQERLDEANDRISELRMNRKDLNSREIRGLEKDRDAAILDGQKMVFGFAKDIYGMDRKQAEAAFTSYMSGQEKKAEINSRKDVSAMQERGAGARNAATIAAQLNTPDRLVFDQLVKDNQGNPVKAAEALQKMKAEKFNMYEAYSKYLTGFAGKETITPPQSFDQFASQFVVPTTKAPGKGATVLKQP